MVPVNGTLGQQRWAVLNWCVKRIALENSSIFFGAHSCTWFTICDYLGRINQRFPWVCFRLNFLGSCSCASQHLQVKSLMPGLYGGPKPKKAATGDTHFRHREQQQQLQQQRQRSDSSNHHQQEEQYQCRSSIGNVMEEAGTDTNGSTRTPARPPPAIKAGDSATRAATSDQEGANATVERARALVERGLMAPV